MKAIKLLNYLLVIEMSVKKGQPVRMPPIMGANIKVNNFAEFTDIFPPIDIKIVYFFHHFTYLHLDIIRSKGTLAHL